MEGSPRPGPNWWAFSGLLVGLGGVLIGIAFVVIGLEVVAQSNNPGLNTPNYFAAFYTLIGVGIACIGLTWPFARMTPRLK
jgi:O-antigen ligase